MALPPLRILEHLNISKVLIRYGWKVDAASALCYTPCGLLYSSSVSNLVHTSAADCYQKLASTPPPWCRVRVFRVWPELVWALLWLWRSPRLQSAVWGWWLVAGATLITALTALIGHL